MGVQLGEVHAGSNKLHGKLSNVKFKLFDHKTKHKNTLCTLIGCNIPGKLESITQTMNLNNFDSIVSL